MEYPILQSKYYRWDWDKTGKAILRQRERSGSLNRLAGLLPTYEYGNNSAPARETHQQVQTCFQASISKLQSSRNPFRLHSAQLQKNLPTHCQIPSRLNELFRFP